MTEVVQQCCGEEATEEELLARLDEVIAEYKGKPGALIPVLQLAQGIFGYLPEVALKHIAPKLGKPYSEVAGVVGFYSFFTTVPRGKHLIRVCLGTACYVRGGVAVLDAFKKELGIDIGEHHRRPPVLARGRPLLRRLRPRPGDHDRRRRAPSRQAQADRRDPRRSTPPSPSPRRGAPDMAEKITSAADAQGDGRQGQGRHRAARRHARRRR